MAPSFLPAPGISGKTRLFGLIGDPVSHSLSPVFWNAAFSAIGLDAVYVPFRVEAARLSAALDGLSAVGVEGINVTIPHKESVARHCTIREESPPRVFQSVNVLKLLPDGTWLGANTDFPAVLSVLRENFPFRAAVLLGAGGIGKTVFECLCQIPIEMVYWFNRTRSRFPIVQPATNTEIRFLDWEYGSIASAISGADLVINATPLGWKPEDELPVLQETLRPGKLYWDLNYRPQSRLLKAAASAGARSMDGRELLIRQGLEGFRFLTGLEPPEETIRKSLEPFLSRGSETLTNSS